MNRKVTGNERVNFLNTTTNPTRGRWSLWLVIYVVATALSMGVSYLLFKQEMAGWALLWRGVLGLFVLIWLTRGVMTFYELPWVRRFGMVMLSLELALIPGSIAWITGHYGLMTGVGGVWLMAATFGVGLFVIRLLLLPGIAVFGVARTLIDEAIRMKIALVFIMGVLLVTPMLPFLLDAGERLNYRMEFFLVWSLGITSLMLSAMTVFLACGTITNDLSQKHVFMTLAKPVGRAQYLFGKWLGIALLNLLLLTVAGAGIYTFARYMQMQPARDAQDRFVADYGILVARRAVPPLPPESMNLNQQVEDRIAKLQQQDPDQYGGDLSVAEFNAVRGKIVQQWHTLGTRDTQTFVFTDLLPAKSIDAPLQLRFKPQSVRTPPGELVKLAFWFNGRPWPTYEGRHYNPGQIVDDTYHVFDLSPSIISADGVLEVRIQNVNLDVPDATWDSSVSFTPGSGLELLYRVGSFGPNLTRTLLITWVRLMFLATLGLAAGTFLGFPVACVLTLMVYFTAVASGYITESLENFVGLGASAMPMWDRILWFPKTFFARLAEGEIWSAIKIPIRMLGQTFVWITPAFSSYNPTPLVSDGRVVPTSMVLGAMLKIGVVWSGIVGVLGYVIFRKRELARVIV